MPYVLYARAGEKGMGKREKRGEWGKGGVGERGEKSEH